MTDKLETRTCTRCGGSGHYSYCQMHGTTCFGCSGSGKQYTKRGRAAYLYLVELRKKPMEEVTFGDWVKMDGIPGFSRTTFFKVDTLESTFAPAYSNHRSLVVTGSTAKGERMSMSGPVGYKVALGFDKATKVAQYRKAVEFQATLTKAGTPRKRNSGAAG